MAVDMFLKIEGEDVKGESRDSVHTEEIDVLAWSWGMTQSGSFHVGGGGGAGKVNVQDISVTKYIDASSPNLLKACASGQHFDKATLTVRKAGGEQLEYLVIEMDKVLVSSVSTGGSGGEDRLTENVTLNFAKFKTAYTPQSDKGAEEGAIEFAWDIEANTPA
ncbi:MAG: type VI secretion system tube protein Hcp [Gammaproteobacteria bacterium]|jgi:type VI secretion system secreted protein Hcp